MIFNEYPDRDMLAIEVASEIAGDLETHLLHHDGASLAVAGGTTPAPIFDDLCAADIAWDRVNVLATDERWVASDNERSNARMIRERLMTDRAKEARFIPFHVPAREPADVLAELEAQIAPQLPLSVLLLGMGEDMHTASLFPGAEGLTEALGRKAPILAVFHPSSQPEARLSLTARILDGALAKHLVIYGQAKKDALDRAMSLPPEQAPIQAVLSEATIHWAP
ncbi:6-phosphogluconolactonase [Roseobacter sp. SK209-2-6]|uniref:6-phosphogluconolactonase n=1 Tax=Roseobacter sp. SK209-2-6 TaxID=388739 RepID=UPI0000F3F616|nr:6-phosphogluconolactonase [Roseobacter sp. SK209-2-6]EBA17822.1 6-phosphogluconolactonase [Roseobacter sp. SK209-2-6]